MAPTPVTVRRLCPTTTSARRWTTGPARSRSTPSTGARLDWRTSTAPTPLNVRRVLGRSARASPVDNQGNEIPYQPAPGWPVAGPAMTSTPPADRCPLHAGLTAWPSTPPARRSPSLPPRGGRHPPARSTARNGPTALTRSRALGRTPSARRSTAGQRDDVRPRQPADSPHSVDGITLLSDVACPAGTNTQCTAVDNHGNEVTFDPATGNASAAAALRGAQCLASVSCPTATQCTAVEAGRAGDHLRSHHARRHRAGRQRQHRPVARSTPPATG